MIFDGIVVAEGAAIQNATIASGASFPSSANAAEMFYRTDQGTLYIHNGATWVSVSGGGGGEVTSGDITTALGYTPMANTSGAISTALGYTPAELSGGKILTSQLPAIAITDTFVVASQVAMLALTAETGDVAVRTDLNKTFILKGTSASTLADWQELLTPTDVVSSVNGSTGVITLTTSNISEGSNLYFTNARSRTAVSLTAGSTGATYNNSTGVLDLSAINTSALLSTTNSFTKAQSVTSVALTDGASIAVNASLSNNFKVVLGGNRTLSNPTGMADGQVINIRIKQDGTGGRTITFDTKYKFPTGDNKVLSTAANATDLLCCVYYADTDTFMCQLGLNYA